MGEDRKPDVAGRTPGEPGGRIPPERERPDLDAATAPRRRANFEGQDDDPPVEGKREP